MSTLSAQRPDHQSKDRETDPPGLAACTLPAPSAEQRQAWEEAAAAGVCLHCQGDLPTSQASDQGPFCCRGCEAVYQMIHGSGMTRYYDLRQGRQAPAVALRSSSSAWLDRLLDEQGPSGDEPLRLTLDIQGVHCAACIWLLEELFRREPGGLDLRINPTLGKVDLVWDPARGDLHHYVDEVERFGYRLGPSRKTPVHGSRSLLLRMAISIALALNVMMFSISYYFGLAPEDGRIFDLFGVLNLVLATVAVIVGGQVFFRGVLAGLRRRVAHLDLPISMGILLTWAGSVFAYLTQGPRAAYFDTLTIFIALMLVGRWAQERILERNRNALLDSAGVDGLAARRQTDDGLETVPAAAIAAGDELWIAPGDLVPVEGILLRQPARASLDWITGESDEISYQAGEKLPAGAFNAGRHGFSLAAVQAFGDSRLHDLLRSQAGTGGGFEPRWWTRVAAAYVALVLLLAGAGFLLWQGQGLRAAIEVTVAILVVTCPCALGLASPLAQEMMHHALRQRGVFVRRAGFMDRALLVRKVLLDKTGTLTLGNLVLRPDSRKAIWRLDEGHRRTLWNLAVRSNHPVSTALAAALGAGRPAGGGGLALDRAGEAVREITGAGLEWLREGTLYRLGKAAFATGGSAGEPAGGADPVAPTLFTADGEVIAALHLEEAFRPDAASELAGLSRAGFELHLLSGDAPAKVAAAAAALGIAPQRARGSLDPEAKAAIVAELDAQDTLMVGDGINDSPSFEAALCTATPAIDRPVLPGKADFYFSGDGIAALRRALFGARGLRRVVRDNLALAALYNLTAVALCLAGVVTPLVAAILMPLSSVGIVSLTAWRLTGRRLRWMS
jgi:Cu2+-exporting ATPase